ncbi:unnamed protein product [Lactuca virosa]|uniref:Uncharacterized protein n=1 Tax=Lactuca virosa TaxID=75947 RepID=A0AAU9PLR6_9ASTR|nr:unnamed protein product [Lactuca virosa]
MPWIEDSTPSNGKILGWDSLPSAERAYAAVRKEMAHQGILGGTTENSLPGLAAGLVAGDGSYDSGGSQDSSGIGLVTKGKHHRSDSSGKPPSRMDKSKLKCSHCGMLKHTKDQYFKPVGYLEWWNDGHKKTGVPAEKRKAVVGTGTDDNQMQGGFGGIATSGVKNDEENAGKGFGALSSDPWLLNPKFFSPQTLEILQNEPQTVRHAKMARNSHKAQNSHKVISRWLAGTL